MPQGLTVSAAGEADGGGVIGGVRQASCDVIAHVCVFLALWSCTQLVPGTISIGVPPERRRLPEPTARMRGQSGPGSFSMTAQAAASVTAPCVRFKALTSADPGESSTAYNPGGEPGLGLAGIVSNAALPQRQLRPKRRAEEMGAVSLTDTMCAAAPSSMARGVIVSS